VNDPLTIVVGGMIAAVPRQGGATWAVLQYLLGFARLGHRVYFVEVLDGNDLEPEGAALGQSANAEYCSQVMREHGLDRSWALVRRGTRDTAGLSFDSLTRIASETSIVIDISGTLADLELFSAVPIRVYLDLDPAFTQLWDAHGIDMGLDGYTQFVTVGQSISTAACDVPTGGRTWRTTWPPVVLDRWPAGERVSHNAFTTVANWRSYGALEHDGVRYGQKAHSLRRLMTLPTRTAERFLLALGIDEAETVDLAALAAYRWQLVSPERVAGSPSTYRRFIRESKAEFGIAKEGYVSSRCGWFSDRSVCYLASGRPVLAQDTGFSRYLPTGAGLLRFETAEEVLEGIGSITADYDRHAAAARHLAEDHFDSDKVLSRLLSQVGATP
jgi:hypothetical protein